MIVLDTNVFVYAVGREHPLRRPCERLFDAVTSGSLPATTIEAVYVELLHVLSRRLARPAAVEMTREFLGLLGFLALGGGDLAVAIDLYVSHARLSSVDALVAAVALRSDVDAVVTADRALSEVPGVRALDPRSPELAMMLP